MNMSKSSKSRKFKKSKQKPPFKKGDQVYALNNYTWGTKPMTVREISSDGKIAICSHPDFGLGSFRFCIIAKVTPERTALLEHLRKLRTDYERLKTDISTKIEALCKEYDGFKTTMIPQLEYTLSRKLKFEAMLFTPSSSDKRE